MYIIFYQLCLQGSISNPGLHMKSFASKSSKGPLRRHSLHWQKGVFCLHIQTTSWDDLIYTGKRQHFFGFIVYPLCQMGFHHHPPIFFAHIAKLFRSKDLSFCICTVQTFFHRSDHTNQDLYFWDVRKDGQCILRFSIGSSACPKSDPVWITAGFPNSN